MNCFTRCLARVFPCCCPPPPTSCCASDCCYPPSRVYATSTQQSDPVDSSDAKRDAVVDIRSSPVSSSYHRSELDRLVQDVIAAKQFLRQNVAALDAYASTDSVNVTTYRAKGNRILSRTTNPVTQIDLSTQQPVSEAQSLRVLTNTWLRDMLSRVTGVNTQLGDYLRAQAELQAQSRSLDDRASEMTLVPLPPSALSLMTPTSAVATHPMSVPASDLVKTDVAIAIS